MQILRKVLHSFILVQIMIEMPYGMRHELSRANRKNKREERNWFSDNRAHEQYPGENEARMMNLTFHQILAYSANPLIAEIFSQKTFLIQDDGPLEDTINFVRRLTKPDRSTFKVPRINSANVVHALVSDINATRLQEMCLDIASKFKTRAAQAPEGIKANDWLESRWSEILGGRHYYDVYSLPLGQIKIRQESIVVEMHGSESKDENGEIDGGKEEWVILGAHLDSIGSNKSII